MPNKKKTVSKIKVSALSRGFSLAKLSLGVGAKGAAYAVGNFLGSEEEGPERLKKLVKSQLESVVRELGELKGSVMKAGQMLSVYGENFLPPEACAVLRSLQSDAPPLAWKEMEKVLLRELGPEKLGQLEIEPEPIGSASLGQVHRARIKSNGPENKKQIALKIQYPGVDRAIDSDIKVLRYVLSATQLIPKGPRYEHVFAEIQAMLRQELDYARELAATRDFREMLGDDPRFAVPEVFPEFSTGKVLATSYEEGFAVKSPEVSGLSQARRNALGTAVLELYLMELFRFGKMQTDPHFGNYRIRLGEGGAPDRIVLLDFGAVKAFDSGFLRPYQRMSVGAFYRNPQWIEEGAAGLDFLKEGDSPALRRAFCDLCCLFTEPFATEGEYDWKNTDLPQRISREFNAVARGFKYRAPPRDVVFLDRKADGVFVFLSALEVKADTRALLEGYLKPLL